MSVGEERDRGRDDALGEDYWLLEADRLLKEILEIRIQAERLERAIERRDEVIDIVKLHSICWFSLTNRQPHYMPRCGSCGGCMAFAALMEFDRLEAEVKTSG